MATEGNDPLVFDTSKCDVEPVDRIPQCDRLLRDPTVEDPPPSADGCDEPPLVPLPPEPPCPDLAVGTATIAQTPGLPAPTVLLTITKGTCCNFDFDLDIEIPEPGCPAMSPDTFAGAAVPFVDTGSELRFAFTKDPAACAFDLDIELDIHCPQLTPSGNSVNTREVNFTPDAAGSLSFAFIRQNDCDYDLEIDVVAPCPAVGPVATTTGAPAFTAGAGELRYRFDKSPVGCEYDLSLELDVHCPQVGSTTSGDPVAFAASSVGSVTLAVVPDPANCDYDLSVEVEAPCPNVNPQTVSTVALVEVDSSPRLFFRFIKTFGCEYELEVDGEFLCPSVGPVLSASQTGGVSTGGGGGGAQVVQTSSPLPGQFTFYFMRGEGCNYDLFVDDITVPCPDILPSGTLEVKNVPFTFGATGAMAYFFSKTDSCVYDLDISLEVPCPEIGPVAGSSLSGSGSTPVGFASEPTGSLRFAFVKTAPCQYDLDVELDAPCPQINPVGAPQSKTVTFSGTPQVSYEFIKDGCEYDLDIDVSVPCPTFDVAYANEYPVGGVTPAAQVAVSQNAQTCDTQFDFSFSWPPVLPGRPGEDEGTSQICDNLVWTWVQTNTCPVYNELGYVIDIKVERRLMRVCASDLRAVTCESAIICCGSGSSSSAATTPFVDPPGYGACGDPAYPNDIQLCATYIGTDTTCLNKFNQRYVPLVRVHLIDGAAYGWRFELYPGDGTSIQVDLSCPQASVCDWDQAECNGFPGWYAEGSYGCSAIGQTFYGDLGTYVGGMEILYFKASPFRLEMKVGGAGNQPILLTFTDGNFQRCDTDPGPPVAQNCCPDDDIGQEILFHTSDVQGGPTTFYCVLTWNGTYWEGSEYKGEGTYAGAILYVRAFCDSGVWKCGVTCLSDFTQILYHPQATVDCNPFDVTFGSVAMAEADPCNGSGSLWPSIFMLNQ